MILRRAGKATKGKKIIYLAASVALGVLLSVIVHGLVEIRYLKWALGEGKAVQFWGGCALSPDLQFGILAAGAIGGLLLGKWWWQIIYVERKWEKKIQKPASDTKSGPGASRR